MINSNRSLRLSMHKRGSAAFFQLTTLRACSSGRHISHCWLQVSRAGTTLTLMRVCPHCSLILVASIKSMELRSRAASMGALMAWQASDVSTWLSTGGLSAIVKNWSENIFLVVFFRLFFPVCLGGTRHRGAKWIPIR